jgi:dimethylargininase
LLALTMNLPSRRHRARAFGTPARTRPCGTRPLDLGVDKVHAVSTDPNATRGVALVRRVSPRLADGIVTHIERTPVDVDLARRQHEAYVAALSSHGWQTRMVAPADDCPDSVFIEDTVVVCENLAVITRPGAPERRPEIDAVEATVRDLGLRVARIQAPGTLDGGDVLQVGSTVYVGRGGRTTAEGVRQLGQVLSPMGRRVVAVPLRKVLHLKSAITALPDGTLLASGDLVETNLFPVVRMVSEEPGAHVVPLGRHDVLIAASAPRTADLIAGLGYTPVVVDITEFERLEGCVTCLSVLIPALWRPGISASVMFATLLRRRRPC